MNKEAEEEEMEQTSDSTAQQQQELSSEQIGDFRRLLEWISPLPWVHSKMGHVVSGTLTEDRPGTMAGYDAQIMGDGDAYGYLCTASDTEAARLHGLYRSNYGLEPDYEVSESEEEEAAEMTVEANRELVAKVVNALPALLSTAEEVKGLRERVAFLEEVARQASTDIFPQDVEDAGVPEWHAYLCARPEMKIDLTPKEAGTQEDVSR